LEQVRALVAPIVERGGAEVYDIEHESGVLRIMVDRRGGIDVDTIGALSREISAALDEHDPFPGQRYLLEVSSPGIERKLRLPEHFRAQIGNEVSVKVRVRVDGRRRLDAIVVDADDEAVDVTYEGADGRASARIPYDEIESARTIFHWGGEPSSSSGSRPTDKPTNKKASAR